MRLVQQIGEEEMVAHFLQTELHSDRFSDAIERLLHNGRIERRIVEQPDIHSEAENIQRAKVLGEWRGYGRSYDVFTEMPDDVQWWRALVNWADLERVKYINDEYWTEFSGGSRLVSDAARRILSGRMPEVAAGYLSMAQVLEQGARFPEMIFIANPQKDDLVVLEGHVRITAHVLHQQISKNAPFELAVLVGCSDQMSK